MARSLRSNLNFAIAGTLLGAMLTALPLIAAANPRAVLPVKQPVRQKIKRAIASSRPITRPQRKPAVAPDVYARAFLRQMLEAEQHLALQGEQVTVLTRNGRTITSKQKVLRNGGRAFRLDYTQPARLAGQVIIDNGRTFWHYSPASKKLEVGPSRVEALHSRVSQVMRQIKKGALDAQYIGPDTIAGRPCAVVQITPRNLSTAPYRRFWIDISNGAQLRIDEFGDNHQLQSSSYYTSITYNPVIPKDSFKPPKTPKGTQLASTAASGRPMSIAQAQTQAGFTILQPTYLPTGFQFQSASVSDFRKQKLVALRYVNSLNVLSLFETGTGKPAVVKPRLNRPRPGVFILDQCGVRVILVGNLSQDEMEKIVISVH